MPPKKSSVKWIGNEQDLFRPCDVCRRVPSTGPQISQGIYGALYHKMQVGGNPWARKRKFGGIFLTFSLKILTILRAGLARQSKQSTNVSIQHMNQAYNAIIHDGA